MVLQEQEADCARALKQEEVRNMKNLRRPMWPERENERTHVRESAGEKSILHGLKCQVKNSKMEKTSWCDDGMAVEVEKSRHA